MFNSGKQFDYNLKKVKCWEYFSCRLSSLTFSNPFKIPDRARLKRSTGSRNFVKYKRTSTFSDDKFIVEVCSVFRCNYAAIVNRVPNLSNFAILKNNKEFATLSSRRLSWRTDPLPTKHCESIFWCHAVSYGRSLVAEQRSSRQPARLIWNGKQCQTRSFLIVLFLKEIRQLFENISVDCYVQNQWINSFNLQLIQLQLKLRVPVRGNRDFYFIDNRSAIGLKQWYGFRMNSNVATAALHNWSGSTQRTENLKFKTESVLKKYLIVPAYLNFRNDLNLVLNFSVDIIRFRPKKLHTEIFSKQREHWLINLF